MRSIFKRGVVGTFHKVSRKYLPLYVAKFQFRYNNRENDNIFADEVRFEPKRTRGPLENSPRTTADFKGAARKVAYSTSYSGRFRLSC